MGLRCIDGIGTNPDLTKRAWTGFGSIRPFDADDITTTLTHPFDDDGYIGYDLHLPSRRFNESYFAVADDEHYTNVADPPYHGDVFSSDRARLVEVPPHLKKGDGSSVMGVLLATVLLRERRTCATIFGFAHCIPGASFA
ncbi:hypothetical protein F0562_031799 [Nyssa sinensis]|uniref:Uncharacterized protein n=1 Tax=Nyssa sinensis TaxID=561372 RepID=A0A5J5AX21_9ASTE|nr:hypothetical protein F0562_031799 [Nyssa sinensis]